MALKDFLFYEEPNITLYCGDCREVLPQLSYDALLTDPPYGIGVKYGDDQDDTRAEFTATMTWLSGVQGPKSLCPVPTAITIPSSRIYDIPRPQWLGCWHKPLTLGYWSTPLIPHWEAIAFYNLGTKKRLWPDAWSLNPERPNGHPTPKPLWLFTALCQVLDGETTVDPFCGSGTTLEAAKNLHRRAIGIEIEPKYCEIAVTRLRQEVLAL